MQHTLIRGSFSLSGELLTVRDLHTFRNQLIKLIDRRKGTAKLQGIKRSLELEIRRVREDNYECTVVTHDANFNQTAQSHPNFYNDHILVRLVSQLGHVIEKFEDVSAT